ncbi:MAG TPA: porin family protein [Flavisolibacter sp.]|nr:porin family protein [Flavisolibacter sp.]
MKKISVWALAMATSTAVFAQDTQPQLVTPMAVKTRIGLRGGVNLADLAAKDMPAMESSMASEAQAKTSFNAGLFVNVPLGQVIRFQPEVNFSSQGGKLQGGSGATAFTYEQDLHYITVPLLFQAQSTKGFFVETGPQLGYLVAAHPKNGSGTMANMSTESNKENFDKFDLAWSAGVGYLSRIGLGLDLRYNHGITNIMEDNNASQAMKGTWKNHVGQISLVYQFGAYK